jgi:hypothetical protein
MVVLPTPIRARAVFTETASGGSFLSAFIAF